MGVSQRDYAPQGDEVQAQDLDHRVGSNTWILIGWRPVANGAPMVCNQRIHASRNRPVGSLRSATLSPGRVILVAPDGPEARYFTRQLI